MKTCIIATFGALVLFFSSCITSFQPLVTADKIITDNRVTGSWKGPDGPLEIALLKESKISKGWSKSTVVGSEERDTAQADKEDTDDMERKIYAVSYTKGNKEYHLLARFMRINGELYMDIGPFISGDPSNTDNGTIFEYNMNYVPTWTIAKVNITDNNHIDIRFADGDYIKKQLLAGNMRLPYEYDPLFGSFVITASSETLQQFVAKYGNDERLFGKNNSITLSRKG